LRFDTASLLKTRTWWADLMGEAHVLPRVAIAIAAATFLVGGRRLRRDYEVVARGGRHWPMWPFLLGHLVVLVVFAWVTAVVFEGDLASAPAPELWVLAWVLLAALTLVLWGAAAMPANLWLLLARRAAGPLLVGVAIGVAAWGAGLVTDLLWVPLSRSTFWMVRYLLALFTADISCDPAEFVVGTSSFAVTIAPECSGYEGIGLILVFLGVYLWRCRADLRFPHALILLPAATLVIWLLNAVRIAGLIAVGTCVSEEAAQGGFHSQAGWLAFVGVALGVVAVVQRIPWMWRQVEDGKMGACPTGEGRLLTCPTGDGKMGACPTARATVAAYLAPLMVLIATMMITGMFLPGFDWAYPARVVLAGAALWYFRHSYTDLRWTWSWTALGIGVVVFGLWMVLEPAAAPEAQEKAAEALRGAPAAWAAAWLVFRVLGSAITVPLAEELAFRGYLTRQLIASDFQEVPPGKFKWLSFLISSVLFGLLHGRWLAGTLAGLCYALALYRRRELADAVVAHGTTNSLIAAYVLATGTWSLW
jgi:exosortase E/protease (VPEID-CTERM system)